MTKKKSITYQEKLTGELLKLPNPIYDHKHRIYVKFSDDRARSNESRLGHIFEERHELSIHDIKRIKKAINKSILKKDSERRDTYNLYIQRTNYSNEYIKISMKMNFKISNEGVVKTIYITKNVK
jgi:hypothetical protein